MFRFWPKQGARGWKDCCYKSLEGRSRRAPDRVKTKKLTRTRRTELAPQAPLHKSGKCARTRKSCVQCNIKQGYPNSIADPRLNSAQERKTTAEVADFSLAANSRRGRTVWSSAPFRQ